MPQVQTPQNRAFVRHLASLLCFGRAQNPTMIRIMLQEQTLGRQLKLCSKGLKRSRYGSLHAYLPIGLAVETSQPHVVRVQRYAINFIFFLGVSLGRSLQRGRLRQPRLHSLPRAGLSALSFLGGGPVPPPKKGCRFYPSRGTRFLKKLIKITQKISYIQKNS